jgi:hypothetical protein
VTVKVYRYFICYSNGEVSYKTNLCKSSAYPLIKEFEKETVDLYYDPNLRSSPVAILIELFKSDGVA